MQNLDSKYFPNPNLKIVNLLGKMWLTLYGKDSFHL